MADLFDILLGKNLAGGGVQPQGELNIAYGDIAPADTSKLWVKTAKPSNIEIDKNLENGVESLTTLSEVLSVADASVASIRVGDKIYLFGGDNSNKIQVFDSVTKNVSVLSVTLPYQLSSIGISAVEDKIYLFGGYSDNSSSFGNKIYVFDTVGNTLTEIGSFPERRYAAACAAIGTDIYIFGGAIGSSNVKSNNIMLFDTINNQLTTLSSATLPLSLSHCGVATIGTNIYVFGGLDVNGARIKKILSFDGINQTISELSVELPIGLGSCSCVAVANNIYIFGGLTNSGVSNVIYVFNAETNSIRLLSTMLPMAIRGAGADCVANKIYIFGGHNGASVTNAILKFTVTFPLTKNNIFVQEDLLKNRFDLLSAPTKTTIGVSAVYKGNADNEAETVEAYLYNEDTEQWELIS